MQAARFACDLFHPSGDEIVQHCISELGESHFAALTEDQADDDQTDGQGHGKQADGGGHGLAIMA
ncbi:MAG TPA: hypothetical protein DCW87_12690 [Comamonadaceae bacterium]|nr:hypothetical protein [Comamonadaceae bacterium]